MNDDMLFVCPSGHNSAFTEQIETLSYGTYTIHITCSTCHRVFVYKHMLIRVDDWTMRSHAQFSEVYEEPSEEYQMAQLAAHGELPAVWHGESLTFIKVESDAK